MTKIAITLAILCGSVFAEDRAEEVKTPMIAKTEWAPVVRESKMVAPEAKVGEFVAKEWKKVETVRPTDILMESQFAYVK